MPDDTFISSIFTTDPNPKGGILTYEQLQARRQVAQALATRNRPYPKTIGEGLTALGEGLGEGWNLGRLQKAEGTSRAANEAARRSLESGGVVAPATPGQGAALDDPAALNALALANSNDIPADVATAAPQAEMSVDEWLQRSARNETGAEREPYRAVGQPNRRGDVPLGKYQIMGENVPEWSKLYLGKEITPQQFLADAGAQETIARGRASEYIAKYGPVGAAEAWFAGEDGRIQGRDGTRPNLGRHLDKYVAKFNEPLADRGQVAASLAGGPALAPGGDAPIKLASLGGVPTPDTAPAQDPVGMVAQALVAQQQPQPQPAPQQVAQVGGAAPPAVQPGTPIVPPQTIPKAPETTAQPVDPGKEPKLEDYVEGNSALKARMENAKRISRDDTLHPNLRASAAKQYEELEKRANDAYTRQWTIWHERTKAKEAFKLTEEKQNLETTRLRGQAEDEAEKRILVQRLGGQEPQKFFDNFKTEQNSAEIASKMMTDNQLIIKAVKDGIIMGTGAGWRLQAHKVAAWALQNGYSSELAANTEIARALAGSRIRESMAQINPSGPASNVDLLIARQLSGTEPSMEPKSFMTLLHKSNGYNAKVLNDFEDKRDYYLSGTRAERQFAINAGSVAPSPEIAKMLANKDDKAARAAFDDTYGEGASALEIERAKRRSRRGQ